MHGAETLKNADTPQRVIGNRYLIHEVIGQGGSGVVWRGHDMILGREIALKEIHRLSKLPSARASRARTRLLQEARASAVLSHEHTVTVYDIVQEEDGGLYIVMELLSGGTLTELVEAEGCLSPERVAAVGVQVLDALEAAHAKGIVHRDVKPGNVMVTAGDRAKLGDFGLASLADDSDLTQTGEIVGSPSYMAPEQATGLDPRPAADIWGLGATLYFALEGVAPFSTGASLSTLHAVVSAPPRKMRHAGPLAGVVQWLLSKRPEDRPGVQELRAALVHVATSGARGRTVEVPPLRTAAPDRGERSTQDVAARDVAATVPDPPWAGRRRRRARRLLVIGSVLAVLVAVGLLLPSIRSGTEDSRTQLTTPKLAAPETVVATNGSGPGSTAAQPEQQEAATTTAAAVTTTTVTTGSAQKARTAGPPPAPPPFTVEARSADGQGNTQRLPVGAGTVELTTRIVDERGETVAGLKMAKFRGWDSAQVSRTSLPELESFDDAARGVTFTGIDGPVRHLAGPGGRTHTSSAVGTFRACGQAGNCTTLRALVEITVNADGTFDTSRGPA